MADTKIQTKSQPVAFQHCCNHAIEILDGRRGKFQRSHNLLVDMRQISQDDGYLAVYDFEVVR